MAGGLLACFFVKFTNSLDSAKVAPLARVTARALTSPSTCKNYSKICEKGAFRQENLQNVH